MGLRATVESHQNQIRRLELLVAERCATIDQLRYANQKLHLENDCLTAMLIAPTPGDAAMLAPK